MAVVAAWAVLRTFLVVRGAATSASESPPPQPVSSPSRPAVAKTANGVENFLNMIGSDWKITGPPVVPAALSDGLQVGSTNSQREAVPRAAGVGFRHCRPAQCDSGRGGGS